jgi:DNA-binding NtrC family response regulator
MSCPTSPVSAWEWEQLTCPSSAMQRVYELARRIARTDLNLLITGEPGTGRETLARFIHRYSGQSGRPFYRFSHGRLLTRELDSRLFRAEEAQPEKTNCCSGTLFFRDLDAFGAESQATLLHLLLRCEAARASRPTLGTADCRIIASASPELWRQVVAGRFRNDLYERIRALEIRVPPLRERPEDIRPLTQHFFVGWRLRYGLDPAPGPTEDLTEDLMGALARHSWPGNVEELKDFFKRVFLSGEALGEAVNRLKPVETAEPQPGPLGMSELARRAGARVERELIRRVLQANGWNRRRASQQLQISYRSLLEKMKRFELR